MVYRYTCTGCGILVRVDHQAKGREIAACQCDVEIAEEVEPE
jgi:hypothetical protein